MREGSEIAGVSVGQQVPGIELRVVRPDGDAVEPGDEFVHARVVLHRAGTQRIHAQVNRVVPRRKAREVANDFDLAHLGKSFYARVTVIRA